MSGHHELCYVFDLHMNRADELSTQSGTYCYQFLWILFYSEYIYFLRKRPCWYSTSTWSPFYLSQNRIWSVFPSTHSQTSFLLSIGMHFEYFHSQFTTDPYSILYNAITYSIHCFKCLYSCNRSQIWNRHGLNTCTHFLNYHHDISVCACTNKRLCHSVCHSVILSSCFFIARSIVPHNS